MPIAKKQQVKKGNAASPGKHKWYKGVLVILAGLALMSAVLFYIIVGGEANDRADLEGYLKDKYGQDFKVADIKNRASMIGDPGQLYGTGSPANNSDLTFEVGKTLKTSIYFDGYSGAVWANEERPRVEAFLQTLYSAPVPSFDLTTRILTPNTPDPIKGEVPSIDDAISRYRNDFYYSLAVRLTVDDELSQNEMKAHSDKIKQIASFVTAKNVGSQAIRYAINIKNKNAGYLCNLDRDQLTDEAKIANCLNEIHRKAW
jgi:hypothetical protein